MQPIRRGFLLAFPIFLLVSIAHADAPTSLSYQGVLTRPDGTALEDDFYDLQFDVFDAPTQGQNLCSQLLTVRIERGLYNVVIQNGPACDLQDAFSGPTRFMQVTVKAKPSQGIHEDLELFPRQMIASVPYALVANKARELEQPGADPIDPLPPGAIILWDVNNTCPPGFSEAEEFRNLTIRGADRGASSAAIPDETGESCDEEFGSGTGTGCGATSTGAYDDNPQVDEMPSHQHTFNSGQGGHGLGTGPYFQGAAQSPFYPISASPTDVVGGDKPHYHPFRTVLFCRKDGP